MNPFTTKDTKHTPIGSIHIRCSDKSGASSGVQAGGTADIQFWSKENKLILEAPATHILHCVNSHQGLVEALREVMEFVVHDKDCDLSVVDEFRICTCGLSASMQKARRALSTEPARGE